MLTHLLDLFIVTKRISDWHHFSKWKFLYSILQMTVSVGTMQLMLSLVFFGNYAGDNVCCIYTGFEVVLSVTGMQVDLSVAVMQMTVSVAIMQLEVSAVHMQVTLSAANMWVTIFIVIMQMRVSVAIVQVVFSVVHYAHNCFYCNYAGDFFFYS